MLNMKKQLGCPASNETFTMSLKDFDTGIVHKVALSPENYCKAAVGDVKYNFLPKIFLISWRF